MPGSTISAVMIVAIALSAVIVVTMSAPFTASATELQCTTFRPSNSARFRASFSVASGSISNARISVMPITLWKPIAWNSACAPFPITAITRESLRANARAAITEVAAVRIAVAKVNSLSNIGYPVFMSERTPKPMTLNRSCLMFSG